MSILTVKNRFKAEPFVGMWDGQTYTVTDTLAVPDYVAFHLKKQSIIKDNPVTGDNEYRLAIVELGEDDSPVEELPVETLDRSDMDYPRAKIIQSGVKSTRPERKQSFGSLDMAESTKERG